MSIKNIGFLGKLLAQFLAGVAATHHEARQRVFEYIEMFYNRQRKHAALGYVSPAAFEELHQSQNPKQVAVDNPVGLCE